MKWHKGLAAAALLSGMLATAAPVATVFAASTPAAEATSGPAANLRITLDNLLGAHAVLAQLAMQAGYSGAPDYNALVTQLNQNTAALSAAIGSIYGSAAGSEFQTMWQGHINDFVNYVVATKNNDPAGQQTALNALEQYKTQFAKFLSGVDPYINDTVLANSLQVHVNQLIATFQAYVKGDYTAEAADFVTAYDHMFMDGDYLATAIAKQFPAKFGTASPNTAAVNLRATLDMLLGGHAVLAQMAMQAGYSGAPTYSAVAGVLGQNTANLASAIASVYGPAAGSEFQTMWTGHINDFVNYTVATKNNDSSGQQAALNALAQYKTQFAQFLAGADPYISPTTLADSLQVHITQLIATFTAYVHKDYPTSASDFVTAYDHMFMDGDYLASAIVQQYPAKFGVNMMDGATSPTTGLPLLPFVAGGALMALAGGVLLTTRTKRTTQISG